MEYNSLREGERVKREVPQHTDAELYFGVSLEICKVLQVRNK